jgi:LysM repeat protein
LYRRLTLRGRWLLRGLSATFGRGLYVALGGLVVIAAALWFLTHKNALDVYAAGDKIGCLPNNPPLTAEDLLETVGRQLYVEYGTEVRVEDEVTLTPVHGSKGSFVTVDFITAELRRKVAFTLEATEVFFNGESLLLLQNDALADQVLDRVKNQYQPAAQGVTVVECDFVDAFRLTRAKRFVPPQALTEPELAFAKLSASTDIKEPYTVRRGDSAWLIADRFGMSLLEFQQLNNLTAESILSVGQVLQVLVDKPLLSVRTVEEVTKTETLPKPVEYRQNPGEVKSYRNLLQEGKDGQRETVTRVVRINGYETGERMDLGERILESPVTEIIEVGTKE